MTPEADPQPPKIAATAPTTPAAEWPSLDTAELPTLSPIEVLTVLLKRPKLVMGLPLATALLAAVVSFSMPPRFTAMATFVVEPEPNQSAVAGSFAGLASQFGIGLGSAARSPDFYAKVLQSRTITDDLLQSRFPDPRGGDSTTLASALDILGIRARDDAGRLDAGRKALSQLLSVRADRSTALVTVSAETRYAAFSAAVLNRLLDLLNRFNLERRQTNAQERRRFVEGRLTEAEAELRNGEGELQRFLERNRNFTGSPQLQFEYDRLQRQVAIKQEVLLTLRREYEQARIQEVNDTPVITVVDRAVAPAKKSGPRRILNTLLGLLLGGVLGVAGAFGAELLERARERDRDHFLEASARWANLRHWIQAPLRGGRPGPPSGS